MVRTYYQYHSLVTRLQDPARIEESTMSTLNILLAETITRDREREYQNHIRFGNTRQTKSRKRVSPRLRWLPTHRVRPAV